jgi:predicted membrane chloride channel (bestrophin family)
LGVSSPIPFELTAASLGLMLVFRTNESYARVVRAHDAWNLVMSR